MPQADPGQASVKRPGRKRRAAGLTLIVLGLLVAGVWAASGWWQLGHTSPRDAYSLSSGRFSGWTANFESLTDLEQGWYFKRLPAEVNAESWWWSGWQLQQDGSLMRRHTAGVFQIWSQQFQLTTLQISGFHVKLWPIPLLLWAAGVPVLRSGIVARRRAKTGQCGKCGYSLAGLAEGAACPECGKGAGIT